MPLLVVDKMKLMARKHLFVVLIQLWLSVHLTLSSSISKDALLTPIPRWQESWTASQAHGTAMAMAVKDCVVLFLRSPSTDVYKPILSRTQTTSLEGLEVHRIDSKDQSSSLTQYAPSWFPIGSHTVCAMTGLALDVEHVCRVLQKQVDDHWFIYQETVTTHGMTQRLSTMLQNECLSKGGRPYGVQCLLVGCDDIEATHGGTCIYSMDCTGNWQSWGRAAVIGKFATEAKKILAQKLQSSQVDNVPAAMECLATSWKETCKDLGIGQQESEDCQVLILQTDSKNRRTSCLYEVSTNEVDRMLTKAEAAIAAD